MKAHVTEALIFQAIESAPGSKKIITANWENIMLHYLYYGGWEVLHLLEHVHSVYIYRSIYHMVSPSAQKMERHNLARHCMKSDLRSANRRAWRIITSPSPVARSCTLYEA
ncbi:hypothetical protein AVEN_97482-1 [Araneus ventricosus]|uniref:Uncharacterized protein n=1 Tax=Araneus ventricosus TaxID=182803 RepID=A0A4Y2NNK4_ARAVE|nr:hypothetical protein AVEN_97482-1 [Araneus ventricosus]